MTTTAARSLYAHEVVPEPAEDAPLVDQLRYRIARATGWWIGLITDPDFEKPEHRFIVYLALSEAKYALTLYALHKGMAGEEAYRWVADRIPDGGAGEWLWQCGEELGIDVATIKAYSRG